MAARQPNDPGRMACKTGFVFDGTRFGTKTEWLEDFVPGNYLLTL